MTPPAKLKVKDFQAEDGPPTSSAVLPASPATAGQAVSLGTTSKRAAEEALGQTLTSAGSGKGEKTGEKRKKRSGPGNSGGRYHRRGHRTQDSPRSREASGPPMFAEQLFHSPSLRPGLPSNATSSTIHPLVLPNEALPATNPLIRNDIHPTQG